MNLNCLILDDEPPAQKLLKRYIGDVPYLNLVAICSGPMDALDRLNRQTIDLIFLDIQMPKMSGIQFLKTLENPPKVIVTTAYPEYAVEGFELSVADYLVKPFSFERFLKAVQKVQNLLKVEEASHLAKKSDQPFLTIKADKKYHRVPMKDIEYLQAFGDYVKVFRIGGNTLLTKDTLSNLENLLDPDQFIRIHRSYIVAIRSIQFLEGNRVSIRDNMIPVSANYRDSLLQIL